MSDLSFVAGDTAPSIYGTLVTSAGAAEDLTDTTVRFQMRATNDGRYTVDAEATIEDEDAGTVRYDWEEGDLATPGSYVSRWLITSTDLTRQHTLPANTITVEPA